MKSPKLRGALAAFLFALCFALTASAQVSAPDALQMLKSDNERFTSGKLRAKDYAQEVKMTATGQKPYAIILTCSDSRVSPEILFDESIGRLFVIRVAGNVSDPVSLGSIEYAAEHLGSNLILVLGHESCGAVKATVDGVADTPNIKALAEHIAPAVEHAKSDKISDKSKLLDASVKYNVIEQAAAIAHSDAIHELMEKRRLQIVGGVYNLHTGRVEWVDVNGK